jgi:quinol monooxygenase YgiN
MAEIALFLTVRTHPGQRDALKTLWETHLKERAAANDAQSHYVYAFDAADENVIRICEIYETRAAFEANAGADWFAAYMAAAMPLLDGQPEFHMAMPQWVK